VGIFSGILLLVTMLHYGINCKNFRHLVDNMNDATYFPYFVMVR